MEHQHGIQQGGQHYYPQQEKGPGYVDQHQGAYSGYPDAQYQNQQYHDPNGTAAAQHYPSHAGGAGAPAQPSGSGAKRGLLIGLLVAVVVLLALVIGLGAGLGVGLRNAKSDLAAAQASLSSTASAATSTPASTASSTPTKTSSSATASATADKFSSCPGANNTVYTSDTDSKKFTVYCGRDYSGKGEADDLNSTKAETMTTCMDTCAGTDGCEGAGWGYIDGSGHMCYMKTNLTKFHSADSGWEFAVLDTSS
ncbi:uncharacterized protein JN550_003197 [Neoarthrinium moseri]|uniref:uncharacterized protein n=1 Tax=Neoarthrinium moseri TaxID=1658444 RepID=UPI001FDC2026|nr:uncharacterized protein JN550_003197 [Neoarthrinium moseri]KAI1873928.1 hypothetical protein JN550_003197 [Neoarthrinium moseri]